MKQIIFLFLIWIVASGVLPLSAQQPASAVEVKVDDLQATPYGISITLRASRSDELLHMLIGVSEGEAIARALSHRTPPRPMTHDLITAILGRTGWRVQWVLIRGIRDATFLADLVLEKNGETAVIDARPSDAMAIAVRSDAKIFVNPEVFELERSQERQERNKQPKEETTPPAGEGLHL